MEVTRPIQNQRISAYWGRAVADAIRAPAVTGPGVVRAPTGTSLPPAQPPAVPYRPARRPFDVQLGADGFSVVPGKVYYVDGTTTTELAYASTAFTTKGAADGYDGAAWVCAAPESASAAKYICACLTYSASSDVPVGWTLRLLDATSQSGETCLPVAICTPGSGGGWKIEQLRLGDILVFAGGGVSPGAHSGDEVAVTLGGTDYNAATDSWTYGDTDEATGLPTYPVYNPSRLYWNESDHTLYQFRRTETFNACGLLVSVSAETRSVVYTAVAEMP